MSVHKFTSIKSVIAKIIRDIGPQRMENDYQSIKEWISEVAVRFLSFNTTITIAKELNIEDYRAELPCDLIEVIALEHNGCRVPYSHGIKYKGNAKIMPEQKETFLTIATVNKYINCEGKVEKMLLDTTKLWKNMVKLPMTGNVNLTYFIEGDYIKTSLPEGKMTLYYKGLYTDEEEYPMIPDNSYLSEAIYWYVLWKLVGRGFQHPTFKWQEIKQLYDEAVRRAKGSINYPSQDEYQHMINVFVSYFPNTNHWHNFNSEPNYKG
jgi:hypothetical protein